MTRVDGALLLLSVPVLNVVGVVNATNIMVCLCPMADVANELGKVSTFQLSQGDIAAVADASSA
jgi:hypothetical protein